MLEEDQKVFKLTGPTGGTPIHVLTKTGYIVGVILTEAAPGVSITIQDKTPTTPNKVLAASIGTLGATSDALVKQWTPPQPVRMNGGIDIVALGAGEVYVWIFYLYEPDAQT
jgi:predicted aconitase